MPDADLRWLMIDLLLKEPLQAAGAAVGALGWIVFVIYLFKELLQNVRAKYWRR